MGAQNTATLTINDNDVPTFSFASATETVGEGDGTKTITVNISEAPGAAVSVDYATSEGTATAGSDYTATNGTLNFGASDTSKTFDVTITDDAASEGDETITLTLSNATGATSIGTPNPATLTIQDNDVVSAGFSSATYTAAEGDGTATIQVDLGGASGATVTIDYATSNGSATSGSDYTAANGTLTFAPGETSKTFDVTITDDSSVEDSETVTLTLVS